MAASTPNYFLSARWRKSCSKAAALLNDFLLQPLRADAGAARHSSGEVCYTLIGGNCHRAGQAAGASAGRAMLTHRYGSLYPQLFIVPRAGGNLVQKQFMFLNDFLFQPSRAGSVPLGTPAGGGYTFNRKKLPSGRAGRGCLRRASDANTSLWPPLSQLFIVRALAEILFKNASCF